MSETDEAIHRIRLAEEEFERMSALYRDDPAAFEQEVRQRISCAIERVRPENQARLRGMQFEIDAKLAHYKDPVARMNMMVRLFWEGFRRFDEVLHGKFSERAPAAVLSFPRKKRPGAP